MAPGTRLALKKLEHNQISDHGSLKSESIRRIDHMKATRYLKSVAGLTALGFILAGCSGGGTETTAPRANGSTGGTGNIPFGNSPNYVAPNLTGGSGSIGIGADDTLSDINTKLDEIKKETMMANENAKKASKKANDNNKLLVPVLGITAGLGALALLNMIGNGYNEHKASQEMKKIDPEYKHGAGDTILSALTGTSGAAGRDLPQKRYETVSTQAKEAEKAAKNAAAAATTEGAKTRTHITELSKKLAGVSVLMGLMSTASAAKVQEELRTFRKDTDFRFEQQKSSLSKIRNQMTELDQKVVADLEKVASDVGRIEGEADQAISDLSASTDQSFAAVQSNIKTIVEKDIPEAKQSVIESFNRQVASLEKADLSTEDKAKVQAFFTGYKDHSLSVLDSRLNALETLSSQANTSATTARDIAAKLSDEFAKQRAASALGAQNSSAMSNNKASDSTDKAENRYDTTAQ